MKDEIKEIERILATNGKYITYAERCYVLDYIINLQTIEQQYSAILSENVELENKITNLQEENRQTKLLKEKYQLEKEVYKSRNEKAIEYINKHLYMESTYGIQHPTFDGKPSYNFDCFELENILNGDNEDGNN